MAFDETAVLAKDFCRKIIGLRDAQFPQHSGKRDREIHVYGADGKKVRHRFNFMDLNQVITEAKYWCDRMTKQRICEWENTNNQIITPTASDECRVVLELLYNNFERMSFYACIWHGGLGGILARSYNNNTANKAIMDACLKAYETMSNDSKVGKSDGI